MNTLKSYLTLVLLTLVTFSCSESEDSKVYSDVTGRWSFDAGSISGEFEIVKGLNGKFSISTGTRMTHYGKNYSNTRSMDLQFDSGLHIDIIYLVDNTVDFYLHSIEISSDFKQMTIGDISWSPCQQPDVCTGGPATKVNIMAKRL